MMSIKRLSQLLILAVLFTASAGVCHANSLEVDGPGFKVQNKTGWFGRHSASYSDALGNGVSRSTGILGRTTTKTSVLGTQTYQRGQNVSVTAPDGSPLVYRHRGLFGIGGRTTKIDGSNILQSVKGLFNPNNPNQPIQPNQP